MASAVNSTACATVHAQRLRTATRAQRVMRDAWAKVRATGVTIREALRQAWAGERERDGSREHCRAPASPTRRRLIGGLAALPLSVEAQGTHPDFELLKLEEQRTLYAAAYEQAVARFEHLASGFCFEPPECMFLKPRDADLGLSQYAIHREDGRIFYYPVERGISSLKKF